MRRASPQSDAELVTASLAGDLLAFEVLIARHQTLIYLEILAYIPESDEAQDVVQETFLKAFQELSTLRDPQKFGLWLRSVARHCCFNRLRAQRRGEAAHAHLQDALTASAAGDPDGSPDETGDRPLIDEFLARLPAESAQVLVLHYLDDLPIATIAQRLGSSLQAVKQRLYRARRHVHQEVLTMIKDHGKRKRLPAGFPSRVIAHLLEAGRHDWVFMRYEQAHAHFQQAVEVAPDDPATLLELGRSYDPIEGAHHHHVEVLERAAAQVPQSIAVLYELASAYRQLRRDQDAEPLIQRCLALCEQHLRQDPTDVTALKYNAHILRSRGEDAAAEAFLRRAVQVAPQDQEAQYFLAFCLDRQGRHDEAFPLYEQVYTLNSKTIWAYGTLRQRAQHLMFRKGDGKHATALMEEVWKLTRRPTEAGNLIWFYSATEQLQEAIQLFESFPAPLPHVFALLTVGVGYARRGAPDKARTVLQTAATTTSDEPLRAELSLHLAVVLFTLRQPKEARKAVTTGLRLKVDARTSWGSPPGSALWHPWTRWLADTLESLVQYDIRANLLCRAVQNELTRASQ